MRLPIAVESVIGDTDSDVEVRMQTVHDDWRRTKEQALRYFAVGNALLRNRLAARRRRIQRQQEEEPQLSTAHPSNSTTAFIHCIVQGEVIERAQHHAALSRAGVSVSEWHL